jgi:outer membrane protein OmpA-like peptidoglycan-associated protein
MAYRLKRGPKLVLALLVAAGVFGGVRYSVESGLLSATGQNSKLPSRALLPELAEAPAGAASTAVSMPGTEVGCVEAGETRALIWAWNAQMGLMFANGGPESTSGSLMCQHGVHLKLIRQDDAEQMKSELLKFAVSLKRGDRNPRDGAHFVAVMGDGTAQFLAALNPELARLGGEYRAQVVASAGYSRGEDKFMGLPAWKQNPSAARGAYIAGYLKDGDWNIALKWAGDNGICNNPDDKVYDPNCLNWAAAKDYIDAAQKYVQGYCEELPVRGRFGKRERVCVNGVVTWTPGDVVVAERRGGLVSIVSTREYASQMPNAVIGIQPFMDRNRRLVEGLISAMFEGGHAVKSSEQALERAAQISDRVYAERDTGPSYWLKYFKGTRKRDKAGLEVELGGSKVNDLGDNVALFGLQAGYANAFEATYTTFGNIVHEQYPGDVPTFPPASEAVDTSFLKAVLARSHDVKPENESVAYAAVAANPEHAEVGRRSFRLEFDTGSANLRAESNATLEELMRGLLVAGATAVEIHGHTDSAGSADANRDLSERRAFAVQNWLTAHAPRNFPEQRFRVFAHGASEPLEPNQTEAGRAANRRVEIVLIAR